MSGGFTDPDPDLILGDPGGRRIELRSSDARIAVYGDGGQLLAVLDGTDTFEGSPFVSFKIFDLSGNVIAQSDRFQQLSGNSTNGPFVRMVHGGFPGEDPRLELQPDAIAGATITPAHAQAASDAANAGAAVEIASPSVNGQTPARITLRAADAVGVERIDTNGAPLTVGGLHATGGATVDGGLSVGGTLTAPGGIDAAGVVYSVAYSGTTDASGFLTVTHGAPWTPTGGWAMTTNPASSFAQAWGIDSFTATTCRLRFTSVASTGALASTAVQGRLFLVQ